jgi:hypothetical protein
MSMGERYIEAEKTRTAIKQKPLEQKLGVF